jgi:hypothetical protein
MYKITMTVNLIHLKDGYQHQYKRTYYRKTRPTVKEMDARLNKYAYSIMYQLQKKGRTCVFAGRRWIKEEIVDD